MTIYVAQAKLGGKKTGEVGGLGEQIDQNLLYTYMKLSDNKRKMLN